MRLRSLPSRSVLPTLALAVALSLTACGGDDVESDAAGTPATGPASVDPGGLDDLADGVDQSLSSTPLDLIADSIDSVLTSVDGYEIDGDAITLRGEGSASDSSSVCTIAGTVLGSFEIPEGTTLTIEFDDGDVDCDI